ncbi:hypothetical protein D3C71_2230080 [compost metagenome]
MLFALGSGCEQGKRLVPQRLDRPQGIPALKFQGWPKRIRFGKLDKSIGWYA